MGAALGGERRTGDYFVGARIRKIMKATPPMIRRASMIDDADGGEKLRASLSMVLLAAVSDVAAAFNESRTDSSFF